ncbi:MAG TPA: spore-associated protein A [Streptomyces sp.]|jgi:hypothetical protein|nr:spore-associated protein A [Streptomyces sp.]
MRSKSAVLAAAVAIAGTGLIATAGTASAAPTSTSTAASAAPRAAVYNGACGAGYSVVNSAGIADLGTVFLTYNSKTGKNCVVTVRNKKGEPIHMSASVRALDGKDTPPVVEEGDFTSFAGPVYVKGAGFCIEWSGVIDEEEYYNSGSNCGFRK